MSTPRLAFFDLDHTLLDGDSDSSFLQYLMERLPLPDEVRARKAKIHAAYMVGEPWQPEYRLLLRQIYAGQSYTDLQDMSRQHAVDRLLPMLFPGARALLERERQERDQLCLLTTTNQIVTQPLVAELGFDVLLSTQLEVQDGLLTGDLVGDFCTGPAKAQALVAHCERLGADPGLCAMFGDGRSDMEALDAVGEPVAVHPTPELRRQAQSRAWPILGLG